MSKVESEMTALAARVNKVYSEWALGHTKNDLITVRDYDPDEYYQNPDVAIFEAEPDYETAATLGKTAMGEAAYDKLGADYDNYNVLELVRKRHKDGKNTLVPTLHLKDVLDTALTHNRLFTVSGGDIQVAEINDAIISPMISSLSILGESSVKRLSNSGYVVNGLQVEAAIGHGMLPSDAHYLERIYALALSKRLGNSRRPGAGVAVHWAMTGTRAAEIVLADGEQAMSVDRVKDAVARIVVGRAAMAVPVPMDVELFDCRAEVLEPRQLESVADVHKMMEEMSEAASELTGKKIYYGLPEGAEPID